MNLRDREAWAGWVAANTDDYGGCCINVARKVMELLDVAPEDGDVDANALVLRANRELDAGITGFMAGVVAQMVSQCHERGEAFRRSWNREMQIGTEGDKANDEGGVLNPALLSK